MIRRAAACVAFALAACSENPPGANDFDVANAASAAQSDIDNYAAASRAAAARSRASARSVSTPSRLPTPSASPAEKSFAPQSAQGAASVVQTYYALIEAGRHREAWRLWEDDGGGSGMDAAAFAESFAKYREYRAEVGAPGPIEAVAGRRRVTVPVKVYGVLKHGDRAFETGGAVTLHGVADIDGATAERRAWRINTSDVRPIPTSATPSPTPSFVID